MKLEVVTTADALLLQNDVEPELIKLLVAGLSPLADVPDFVEPLVFV